MFKAIYFFEVRYHLRQLLFYVLFALFFGLAFGAVATDSISIGTASGNVERNASIVILKNLVLLSTLGILPITALVANAAQRDFEQGTASLFFAKPIRKLDYLLGRFCGGVTVCALIYSAPACGMLVGSRMPWLPEEQVGPLRLWTYGFTLLVWVLPNLVATSGVIFAVAISTRNLLSTYLVTVLLAVAYSIASVFLTDLDHQFLASLLDPFGVSSLQNATKYWTLAEKNAALPTLTPDLLANRLLWLGFGFAVLGGACALFRPSHALAKTRGRAIKAQLPLSAVEPAAAPALKTPSPPIAHTAWHQLLAQTRFEVRSVLRSVPFLGILAFGLMNLLMSSSFVDRLFGTPVYPTTRLMLELITDTFTFLLPVVITLYSGELIWRERTFQLNSIYDALPTPNWVHLAAKTSALFVVVVLFLAISMVATLGVQLYRGFHQVELPLYAQGFGLLVWPFLLIGALAIFLQVMLNNKFVGFACMILYLLSDKIQGSLGLEHNLYRYAEAPEIIYSDLNGYGHFVTSTSWFLLYWTFGAGILLCLAFLFWVRGGERSWRLRCRLAVARCQTPGRWVLGLMVLGFIVTGTFIFYNTNVVNEYLPRAAVDQRRAQYEEQYRKYFALPQPKITAVKADVDLFPEERRAQIRGNYELRNKSQQPIEDIHLTLPPEVQVDRLELAQSQLSYRDDTLGYFIYRLDRPLSPGEGLDLAFELSAENPGFVNHNSNLALVHNGTFLGNQFYFPAVGYNPARELVDRRIRRKYGLAAVNRLPPVDDLTGRQYSSLSRDADWIDFETTVSTSAEQVAIAPGYLQKTWEAGGRRFFHYRMDSKIPNLFAYLSADYAVAKDRWHDVAIEVYHHPTHTYNIARMIHGVKRSLEYFSENFGPYQHRQLRIVEFPRYARFALSLPNTIPFAESLGFIARIRDQRDIDYVFYVTAHEVAHQWWGHQVVGANVQGANLLSESLAQYSALMVMEKEFGRDQIQRFLKYELDAYLRGRGSDLIEEVPLMLVEDQPYIHYHKGSIAMYALREALGEEVLNQALRRFLHATAQQEPPYTTSQEWLKFIREVTPPDQEQLLVDLFATITLFDNRVKSATYSPEPGGGFRVNFVVEANKLRADGQGHESEVLLADWIEIAVFGADEKPLYFARQHLTEKEQSFTVVVDALPVTVGIDPYYKLIDRNGNDNRMKVVAAGVLE